MCAVNANSMNRCLILTSCHIQYFTVLYAALTCWLCPSSFRVHVFTRKDKRRERLVTVSSKPGYAVNTVESCFMVSVTNSWDQGEFSKNVTWMEEQSTERKTKKFNDYITITREKTNKTKIKAEIVWKFIIYLPRNCNNSDQVFSTAPSTKPTGARRN